MLKADVVERVCAHLARGNRDAASQVARENYPFSPGTAPQRRYSAYQQMRVFYRDGFVDRYDGERLIFPGTIRLLSQLMPDEFPAHKNWKLTETHLLYWELFPTIDHIQPVARDGKDDESNWVCTSMRRNQVKSHWLLNEIGWKLLPPGDRNRWDGLTMWFLDFTQRFPAVIAESDYLRRWRSAAKRVVREICDGGDKSHRPD